MAYVEQWYIGPTAGEYVRGIEGNSVEICAEETDDADWFEWNGSEWIIVENILIECADENDHSVSDENNVVEDYASENNQIHDLLEGHLQENGRSQTDFRKSIGEDSSLEDTPEDDPRDMYFILRDWDEIWQSTKTGYPVYSSNYPGGIFRTEEGYEFELEIYPKEICRKIFFQISRF